MERSGVWIFDKIGWRRKFNVKKQAILTCLPENIRTYLFIGYMGYTAHSKTYPSVFSIKFYVRTHVSPSSNFETEKNITAELLLLLLI
jgi:hypothetical protein